MKNYAYTITMSSGSPLSIDKDELDKVIRAISARQPCMLRSGIFNASFYVSITRDEQRMDEFGRELHLLHDDKRKKRVDEGPKLLKDIFGEDVKQLVKKMNREAAEVSDEHKKIGEVFESILPKPKNG